MSEVWRPMVDLEDRYEVSDQGRVRNVQTRRVLGLTTTRGYLYAVVRDKNGRCFRRTVHRLVLEAFVGRRPPGLECCHEDDDRANNRLDNLSWGTRSFNRRSGAARGREVAPRGAEHGNAKLTEDDVRTMRALKATMSETSLAKQFGINRSTAHKIVTGKAWVWLV